MMAEYKQTYDRDDFEADCVTKTKQTAPHQRYSIAGNESCTWHQHRGFDTIFLVIFPLTRTISEENSLEREVQQQI